MKMALQVGEQRGSTEGNTIRSKTGIQQPASVRQLTNSEIPARASETKQGYSYASVP